MKIFIDEVEEGRGAAGSILDAGALGGVGEFPICVPREIYNLEAMLEIFLGVAGIVGGIGTASAFEEDDGSAGSSPVCSTP